ncbi:hypothetical protein D3C76_1022850 [compost metagenome]
MHQGFADFQSSDQALYQQRRGKTQHAKRADLQIIVGIGTMADIQQEARTQDAKCADGGNEQADAFSQQGIADGHRDDQQVANSAGHSASGVEQPAKQQDVDQSQAEQLRRASGALEEDCQQDIQHQVQPAATAQQVVIGGRKQAVVQVAGNQQYQGDADA